MHFTLFFFLLLLFFFFFFFFFCSFFLMFHTVHIIGEIFSFYSSSVFSGILFKINEEYL